MALNFPANPTIGDFDSTGSWQWDGEVWRGYQLSPSSALVSPTPPLNPTSGTIWYNTVDGTFFVYVNDGDSSQWVEVRANSAAAGTLGKRVDALESTRPARNYLLNADFNINQRGLTSGGTATNGFGFDRWMFVGGTNMSAQTFANGVYPVNGYITNNYLRLTTSGQSAAGDLTILRQRIEDVRVLAGKTVTVSFYAKAATGTPYVGVEFEQNGMSINVDTIISSRVQINTNWARYSITGTIPAISSSVTLNAGHNLLLSLWTSAGTTWAVRSGGVPIQNNTIDFWGVQVEEGSTATPFRTAHPSIQAELAACQRYYQRFTLPWGTPIYWNWGTAAYAGFTFPTMRVSPSIAALAVGSAYIRFNTAVSTTDVGFSNIGTSSATMGLTTADGYSATTGYYGGSTFTLNAEL